MVEETAQQEGEKHEHCVDSVPARMCISVREKQVSQVQKDGRNLHEKQHGAENDHEVHKVECLVESEHCNNMVCVGLVVQGRVAPNHAENEKEIDYEIPTRVNQCPNVNIPHRIDALVTVEHGLVAPTDVKHGDGGEENGTEGVRNAGDVSAILSLLLDGHISVDWCHLISKEVHEQVLHEEKGNRKERELEIVHLVVIGRPLRGIVPKPGVIRWLAWVLMLDDSRGICWMHN